MVTVTRGVAYGELPRQKLDLYAPAESEGDGPVMVFFYGGGWRTGDRVALRAVAEVFARAGITFVAPDYRLYPQVAFPAFVEDSALAVAWVWRNLRTADGAPRPLIVAGHSAGAYNAAMVALDQSYLAADGVPADAVSGLIGLAGPYAPFIWQGSGLEDIFPDAERDKASVVDFVGEDDPPMLLIYGDADRVVGRRHIDALVKAATDAGVSVESTIYPGFDHMGVYFALMDGTSAIDRSVKAFVEKVAGR